MTQKDKAVREALGQFERQITVQLGDDEIIKGSAYELVLQGGTIDALLALLDAETQADTIKSPWFFADDGTLNQLAVISLPFQAKEAYDDLVKVKMALEQSKPWIDGAWGYAGIEVTRAQDKHREALTILNRLLSGKLGEV